jgi:hypothetical protein
MMFSDTYSSTEDHNTNNQNVYMGLSNPYGEENEQYFKSPMNVKAQMD